MATMTFKAKIQQDGSIAIPKRTRERLEPLRGESVEVSIHTDVTPSKEDQVRNPLYDIIGIAKGGRPDGAENHDMYLYGEGPMRSALPISG